MRMITKEEIHKSGKCTLWQSRREIPGLDITECYHTAWSRGASQQCIGVCPRSPKGVVIQPRVPGERNMVEQTSGLL